MRLLIIFALIAGVLGSSITNGTCYWKAGEEADAKYSPCGNTIDGNWPCCQLGDKCNDHNTCTWNSGVGKYYTYVAGCTDPNYEDDSCPYKGNFSEYEWVGIAWDDCETSGTKVDWYGCKNDGYPTVRISTESENCNCNEIDQPLLEQAPKGLVAMGYLPASKMGEISWLPGYSRTDPVVASSATTVSTRTLAPATSLDTMTTSSSSTGSSAPNESSGSTIATSTLASSSAVPATGVPNSLSMNTGTKVGLGIGFAAIGLIAAMLGLGFLIKKRKPGPKKKDDLDAYRPQEQDKRVPTPAPEPAMLAANSTQRNSTWSGQKSELPGSPPNPSVVDTISPISTVPVRNDDHVIVYQPFRYQSADMGGITELPREERPSGLGVEYAAYKTEEARNDSRQANRIDGNDRGGGARDDRGRDGNFHELPG